ncbi:recombinase [Rhizobium rhizosphaerae]|uniref:Recombinase n=1 Tax=Xaviernesmea rhizosphaerae TaxID=1672749 RepID=A0A1Q9AGB6_9HYPH|nr:type II toxin-antitoxin system RelE/ParE family toxin [Xaviernesmea rhizosphaerae]OLP53979.1 recombinase [Xaviernesmea rhizosphaerae]
MNRPVLFSPEAITDLSDFLDYLVPLAGEAIARRTVDRLINHCRESSLFPERGQAYDDIRPGLRIVGYRRRASIAFVVMTDRIMILRIFIGGRQIRLDGL